MKKAACFAAAAVCLCAVSCQTMKTGRTSSILDPVVTASRHTIEYNRPAIDFFEGAVLGNGGLGTIVCTRPDAVVLYFGHNDVWDIRLAEDNKDKIGTFREIFDRVSAIPNTFANLGEDPWYSDYLKVMRENYAKPYPRPFPCGSVVLWFDRREAELLGHRVHIDSGLCEVDFLIGGEIRRLEVFADMNEDVLWCRMVDSSGAPAPSPFAYVTLRPDPATPAELPECSRSVDTPSGALSFRQILPFSEFNARERYVPHVKDRAFRLTLRTGAPFRDLTRKTTGSAADIGIIPAGASQVDIAAAVDSGTPFVMTASLTQGLAHSVPEALSPADPPDEASFSAARSASDSVWKRYWSASGIDLGGDILEETWYRNLYFLRCAVRPGVTCPGLFANWSFGNIGTAWHGDYHMNYNTQQPFWATFSTNHIDLNLPYADMVENILLPVSKAWARDYYEMRGAFFPHSAYPVEMTIMPYPLPTWGWEVFETPWSVQGLWWHYTYTGDTEFLRDRAFGVMKEAVMFLVDYMKRPEAHGARWNDDRYHIFPSVPPELYGLRPGFDKNHDTQADLALTKFLFDAYIEACVILGIEESERELAADVRDILAHFPDYPTAQSQRGEVFVSVPGEDPEVVYNCPASLMTVFPGEQHGLHSPREVYDMAVRTYRNQQNEGGNDLVFLNIQAARLGILDLDRFRRQIRYCLLPNGTCTDKVLQIHGRYTNNTPFDFMGDMGIWFENFALPAVIDECLLQSYNGELRLFPNWTGERDAEFRTLRARGAFLVSARMEDGTVAWAEILSEKGGTLTVVSPWGENSSVLVDGVSRKPENERITVETTPGQTVALRRGR